MIRVTQTQAARYLLANVGLTGDPAVDPVEQVKTLVAVPADDRLTTYLILRMRLADLSIHDFDQQLTDSQRLIRRPAVRNEVNLIAAADYAMMQAATKRQRRQHFNTEFINWQIEAAEIETLAEAIMTTFDQAPQTLEAITASLPEGAVKSLTQTSRGGRVTTLSNVVLALQWLAGNGQLIAAPAKNGLDWQTENLVFTPAIAWLSELDPADLPAEAAAQLDLTRRYLQTYGPATEADISFWTGFSKGETARAIGTLTRETTLVMVDGLPGAMMLLKSQADALQSTPADDQPIITILPADDPFVRAHRASRARLNSEPRIQRLVFNNAGQAKPTILFDGQIVGVWSQPTVTVPSNLSWEPLVELNPATQTAIDAKLTEMAAMLSTGDKAR